MQVCLEVMKMAALKFFFKSLKTLIRHHVCVTGLKPKAPEWNEQFVTLKNWNELTPELENC